MKEINHATKKEYEIENRWVSLVKEHFELLNNQISRARIKKNGFSLGSSFKNMAFWIDKDMGEIKSVFV